MLPVLANGTTADLQSMPDLLMLFRTVKKSPTARYGKPVMMGSSDSGAWSDAGQGSTSDGEDVFPASYQPPLAGLMSKGELKYQGRPAGLVLQSLPSALPGSSQAVVHRRQGTVRRCNSTTARLSTSSGVAGKVQCASLTAAAEVGMALESEAVASAVREADFERMQREAAEASIASLHDALEKLKQKLKTTQVLLLPLLQCHSGLMARNQFPCVQ